MTIIAIAAAAIAAVVAYNKRSAADPAGAENTVRKIRQSTSVVLAIGDALWAILDALIFLTRRTGSVSGSGQRPGLGRQLAVDQTD